MEREAAPKEEVPPLYRPAVLVEREATAEKEAPAIYRPGVLVEREAAPKEDVPPLYRPAVLVERGEAAKAAPAIYRPGSSSSVWHAMMEMHADNVIRCARGVVLTGATTRFPMTGCLLVVS